MGMQRVLCALLPFTSALTLVAQVYIDTGARQMLVSSDKGFAMGVAQLGLAEVKYGNLAAQKAKSPELKQFGRQMAEEHAQMNEKLKEIVASEHMKLPEVVSADDQKDIETLSRLSGAEFDRTWLKHLIKTHRFAIKQFSSQAKHGKDERLRSFASESLSVLEKHLQKIKALQSQIGTT